MKSFYLIILCYSLILAAPSEDKVSDLFGDLYKGDIFSGYLDGAEPGHKLHYVFLPSQNDPAKDPLVLWLNGGPGCSSLLGWVNEHGPVVSPEYGKDFVVNDYSWNKFANMIYLESPVGVGFSYSDKGDDDLKSDDKKSGKDNRAAILNFLKKFPEYKKNEFYIAGESYAGVYVPVLASMLLNDDIKIKGILVGNGLTDLSLDIQNALVEFAYDHGLYSSETKQKLKKACPEVVLDQKVTRTCNEARKELQDALQGINIYDIYRTCPPPEEGEYNHQRATLSTIKKISKLTKPKSLPSLTYLTDEMEPPIEIWPRYCKADTYTATWLNRPEIKKALHVKEDITFNECSQKVGENYTLGQSYDIYEKTLIPSDKKLRIWFYSGDTDAAVPFNGSFKWITKLKLPVLKEYRNWVVHKQTAGFVQEYKGLTYVSVKGTGHMVPQWKREESFVMFNAFLKGEELPKD